MKTTLPPALGRIVYLILLALGLAGLTAQAQQNLMSYQGFLTDGSGNPLGNTNTGPTSYNVIFRIWNEPTGGTAGGANELWAELQTVTVNKGYFSVLLGQGSQYSASGVTEPRGSLSGVFTNGACYIEMTVVGVGSGGANVTLLPRLQFVYTPYAFSAANATTAFNLANGGGATVLSSSGTNLVVTTALVAPYLTASNLTAGSLTVGTLNASSLNLGANSSFPFTIATNNWVGIGIANPQTPLEVEGEFDSYANYTAFLGGPSYLYYSPAINFEEHVAILAPQGSIATGDIFLVLSDARVKEIVRRSDTSNDLATVRKLRITDYRKLDKAQFGGRLEKGVIAQEVQQLVPEAVTTSTGFIPNIYALPKAFGCTNGTLLVTLAKPHDLAVGDQVKLVTDAGTLTVQVSAIPSPLSFAVANVPQAPAKLFVYGKQVKDLHEVNYDRLFTTGLGAIQELATRDDAQAAEIVQLKAEVADLKQLKQEVADLKHLVVALAAPARNGARQAANEQTGASETDTTASLDR